MHASSSIGVGTGSAASGWYRYCTGTVPLLANIETTNPVSVPVAITTAGIGTGAGAVPVPAEGGDSVSIPVAMRNAGSDIQAVVSVSVRDPPGFRLVLVRCRHRCKY